MKSVAIIGSGVVGNATGKGFIAKGYDVLFIDINPVVVKNLCDEELNASTDYKTLLKKKFEAFFLSICTPTANEEINLNYLKSASVSLAQILKTKKDYNLVVVRSTVPPGTVRNIIIPIIEKNSDKIAGVDFGVCMNPEYLREDSAVSDFCNQKLTVIGSLDNKSLHTLQDLYRPFNCPVQSLSLEEAEAQKYIHNLFNACKISFFNEIRMILEEIILRSTVNLKINLNGNNGSAAESNTDFDIEKIFKLTAKTAEASYNPEYGIKNLGPFGKSCLPKDTRAFLTWTKKELQINMPLLQSIIDVNELMKEKQIFEKMTKNLG